MGERASGALVRIGPPTFAHVLSTEEHIALEKNLQNWATAADVPLHLVERDILRLDLAQLCRKERLIFWQVMQ